MIITCPNCNKKFEIDASLIPSEGRKLQCGSCNNVWIYKFEEKNNDILNLIDEIDNEDIPKKSKIKEDNKQPTQKIKNEIINEKKEKIPRKQKNTNTSKNTEITLNKFFSYLIVSIISFLALIILLDTLKTPLISVFPGLEIIIFNLFETLQDIKLFIIDLV